MGGVVTIDNAHMLMSEPVYKLNLAIGFMHLRKKFKKLRDNILLFRYLNIVS